ncbi:hypothetical protein AB3N58_16895 [Leptospira sp. WS60.C2]
MLGCSRALGSKNFYTIRTSLPEKQWDSLVKSSFL